VRLPVLEPGHRRLRRHADARAVRPLGAGRAVHDAPPGARPDRPRAVGLRPGRLENFRHYAACATSCCRTSSARRSPSRRAASR
jgi:hypothetical protein